MSGVCGMRGRGVRLDACGPGCAGWLSPAPAPPRTPPATRSPGCLRRVRVSRPPARAGDGRLAPPRVRACVRRPGARGSGACADRVCAGRPLAIGPGLAERPVATRSPGCLRRVGVSRPPARAGDGRLAPPRVRAGVRRPGVHRPGARGSGACADRVCAGRPLAIGPGAPGRPARRAVVRRAPVARRPRPEMGAWRRRTCGPSLRGSGRPPHSARSRRGRPPATRSPSCLGRARVSRPPTRAGCLPNRGRAGRVRAGVCVSRCPPPRLRSPGTPSPRSGGSCSLRPPRVAAAPARAACCRGSCPPGPGPDGAAWCWCSGRS
ncbi:hypothetical protein SCNRRL3882_1674 [Streptomyces chartreusis NRRL 3882]|uniref:Uncharacterized protein n=1 Tax=Streptomyces chartreusis NRRL 3882 TaxID=1079985 RepID=A0A2N9B4D1_STRCX|nr:hypothetical protein SCNRRL3882_1674 [Streptomyces chartreusis NRRL 3882]